MQARSSAALARWLWAPRHGWSPHSGSTGPLLCRQCAALPVLTSREMSTGRPRTSRPPEQLGESTEHVEAQATQGQADASDSGKPSHGLLSEMVKCSAGAGGLAAAIKGPRGTGRIEEGGHHSLVTPIHPHMWAQPLPSAAPGQGLLPVCAGDAPVLRSGTRAPWHGPGPGLRSWAVPRCWCQSSCRSSATSLVCMGVCACGR